MVSAAESPVRRWSTAPWQLDAWVGTYLAIGSSELAAVSPDVGRISGQPPRTLEQALS